MSRLKIFALILASVYCASVSGQEKGPSFIGVAGGISMPLGNWGKSKLIISTTDYANDPAGFAAIGPVGGVEGAWFLNKHIGIGGLFTYASYQTKDLAILSLGYERSFDVDSVNTTAGNYRIWNLMPGVYFNYGIQSKLSFTGRALVGITHVTTPRIAVAVFDGGIYDGTPEQKEASKTSYIFDVGAGLSYRVIKSVGINLKADYFYSKPDISIQNTLRQNRAGRRVDEYDQPLSGLNISLGAAYFF
ncbi:MAG TPA: outer membrane beta-barrel protein [Puia sp.]|jgi:hypothetical protein|nr:outer membrane beta-barrel protein [Puia sp.]